MKIIDLKKNEYFIRQYVNLRNSYIRFLLTSKVNICKTKKWLKRRDIEVLVLIQRNVLLGAVILYLKKGAEVAFFVKETGKGFGTILLNAVQDLSKKKGLNSVWAWVLKNNKPAQKAFLKNGYLIEKEDIREYNNTIKNGIIFRKALI